VIEIISKTRDFIVAYKPHGLPTVPLKGGEDEDTLLRRVSSLYPETLKVHSRHPWEGGVLHRLDSATAGLVLVARNDEAFLSLSELQAKGLIKKTYKARTARAAGALSGFPEYKFQDLGKGSGVIETYFRSYGPKGSAVRPVLDERRSDNGKLYSTAVSKIEDGIAICEITLGFRHQIRAHLAYAGHPIVGDSLYGGVNDGVLRLVAVRLEFPDPATKEMLSFRAEDDGPVPVRDDP